MVGLCSSRLKIWKSNAIIPQAVHSMHVGWQRRFQNLVAVIIAHTESAPAEL